MNAYSKDLRLRVLDAVDRGVPRREVSRLFGISLSTIKRYLKRRRQGERPRPKAFSRAHPNHLRDRAKEGFMGSVGGQQGSHSRAPLRALGRRVGREGLHLHHEPGHTQAGMDLQKKSLVASERNEEERGTWRERVKCLDANKLIFVDECGTNIALTRLYARAPKGEQRAYGKAPRNWGKNLTLIAAMSAQGMGAAMSVEGATDSAAFQRPTWSIFSVPPSKRGRSW